MTLFKLVLQWKLMFPVSDLFCLSHMFAQTVGLLSEYANKLRSTRGKRNTEKVWKLHIYRFNRWAYDMQKQHTCLFLLIHLKLKRNWQEERVWPLEQNFISWNKENSGKMCECARGWLEKGVKKVTIFFQVRRGRSNKYSILPDYPRNLSVESITICYAVGEDFRSKTAW